MFDDLLSTRQSWKGERGRVTILEFSRQAVEGREAYLGIASPRRNLFSTLLGKNFLMHFPLCGKAETSQQLFAMAERSVFPSSFPGEKSSLLFAPPFPLIPEANIFLQNLSFFEQSEDGKRK